VNAVEYIEMAFNQGDGEPSLQFPVGFLWGVSTASHQVEGSTTNNQWWAWEEAGRIKSGERVGLACDWWNHTEPDFDLARDLGINSLRLSLEWSRIEPREGCFDEQALGRYQQMLRSLLERGIQPVVCLHHFTHPRWFEERGAFLCPEAEELFERYTRCVLGALAPLCRIWVTFNEPNVFSALGYVTGEFPPGKIGKIPTFLRLIGALARAHLRAYRAIHALRPDAEVGWAQHYVVFKPVSQGPDSWIAGLLSHLFNEGFIELIERGRLAFPFSLLDGKAYEARGACDFVGLNVYSRFHVEFDWKSAFQLFGRVFVPPDVPQGDRGVEKPYGEAYPPALRAAVKRAAKLGKPIYILENGIPDAGDRLRPWLIVNAVKEVHGLIAQGHDIRGYFHWTLTDNFEWSEGWKLRFGLVALDPQTQQRTPRGSFHLYREIAQRNELPRDAMERYQSPAGGYG
jgi:beta-glucosidase